MKPRVCVDACVVNVYFSLGPPCPQCLTFPSLTVPPPKSSWGKRCLSEEMPASCHEAIMLKQAADSHLLDPPATTAAAEPIKVLAHWRHAHPVLHSNFSGASVVLLHYRLTDTPPLCHPDQRYCLRSAPLLSHPSTAVQLQASLHSSKLQQATIPTPALYPAASISPASLHRQYAATGAVQVKMVFYIYFCKEKSFVGFLFIIGYLFVSYC